MGVIFIIISNIFLVLQPIIVRWAIDMVSDQMEVFKGFGDLSIREVFFSDVGQSLLIFGALILACAIFQGLFMFLMRQTVIVMSRMIEYDLKNEIYEKYQNLDQAFYRRNNTGDLMSRISEDVSKVRMYLGPAVMYAINVSFMFILIIGTMLSVNPKLTLYVLIPLPILSVSIYYISNLINKKSEKIQIQMSALTTSAQESFSGIRVIKAHAKEPAMMKRFAEESEEYKTRSLDLAKVRAYFVPLMLLLIGVSTILTIFIGGAEALAGRVSAGNIAEFVIYVNRLTWPVASLGWLASIVQQAEASQKRINEFLKEEPSLKDQGNFDGAIKGKVSFQNVGFVYPDTGVEALKNVSFDLEAGQRMAIIGRTGSGKSTIAELLERMFDPTEGSIKIDGRSAKDFKIESLRKGIGYVPQEVFLFSETIADNIAFGNQVKGKEGEERVAQAAKKASILEEIEAFPNGMQTMVGERGVTLSGGQKQRISLARAFMGDPSILLLDDCLSAVDASTEHRILQNLEEVLENRTSIIITHRIFSLLSFDKILVLDQGELVEEGTHEELLSRKGIYYDLYQQQQMSEKVN